MVTLVNRAKVSTSTTGTGTITLGAAADGYQTFANAGVTDGQTVRYVIEDGSNWEIGAGVYTASGTTLSRTVIESNNADAAINLSGSAVVFLTAAAGDIVQPGDNVSTLTNDANYTTNTGTVTSVGGTGTVNGLSLSGTVTSSGNLTLGGTLAISNADWSGTDLSVANGGTGASSFTANNVLLGNGTSSFQTVAPGTSGNVLTSNGTTWTSAAAPSGGTYTFTASGAISSGDVVVLNANGTVSVAGNTYTAINPPTVGTPVSHGVTIGSVAPAAAYDATNQKVVIVYDDGTSNSKAVVGAISGTSITFGTPATFYASGINQSNSLAIAFDPITSKVVIAASLNFNLRAVVGTVSGTSITFGSDVIVHSGNANNDTSIVSINDGGKVVFSWRDGSTNYGNARVGTISGTSISLGTTVVYNSAGSFNNRIVYDSSNAKVVVSYVNGLGYARVGTVNGTSISFGSEINFSNGLNVIFMAAVFDTSTNKVVVSFRDTSANDLLAVVGTVSGTSTSWGAPATIVSGQFPEQLSSAADTNAGQVAFFWRGTSSYGRFKLGTVSGSSISFGTEVVFESAQVSYTTACFDTAQNRVSVTYRDDGNSNTLTTAVVTASTASSTANNWVGISTQAISNAATGKVTILGGVNEQQSGLTIGSVYYVADDGSLTTSTASGRKIGKAIATTKLLITEGNA